MRQEFCKCSAHSILWRFDWKGFEKQGDQYTPTAFNPYQRSVLPICVVWIRMLHGWVYFRNCKWFIYRISVPGIPSHKLYIPWSTSLRAQARISYAKLVMIPTSGAVFATLGALKVPLPWRWKLIATSLSKVPFWKNCSRFRYSVQPDRKNNCQATT